MIKKRDYSKVSAWSYFPVLVKEYGNPDAPGQLHYQVFQNPWLESANEERVHAWPAVSLRPAELEKAHPELDQPGARIKERQGFRNSQWGFLVVTRRRVIHEPQLPARLPSGWPHGLFYKATLAGTSRGIGPIMAEFGTISSLESIPDSPLVRIGLKDGRTWYVSIGRQGGGPPRTIMKGSVEARDQAIDAMRKLPIYQL